MKTLVTGANGCIGNATVKRLNESGASVVGYDKAAPSEDIASLCDEFIIDDIRNYDAIKSAIADVDHVVHLAGWVHDAVRDRAQERLVYELNAVATKEIARACTELAKGLILSSTVAVYGDDATGLVRDTTEARPSTAYAKSKLEAEGYVRDAGGTVLRLPMVYGALDRGNMNRLISAVHRRRFFLPGKGTSKRSFVGRWNVAEGICCVIDKTDRAAGKTFVVTDGAPVSLSDLCRALARLLNVREPIRIPVKLVSMAAEVGTFIGAVTGTSFPVNREALRKLTTNLVFEGAAIRNELGFRVGTRFEEGVREEVEWYLDEVGRR